MDYLTGHIMPFTGAYVPRGWGLCDGSLLPIDQLRGLYAIIGNKYGGDGQTTFALPDFQGRFPIHPTAGLEGVDRQIELGQRGGDPGTTLSFPVYEMNVSRDSECSTRMLAPDNIEDLGDTYEIKFLPPFQVVNFIIRLDGKYPARN
jgi:microcystin-dependent protein